VNINKTKEANMNTLKQIHEEATKAAKDAVDKYLKEWKEKTGGNKYGEPMYCGFAWVSLHGVKLSTKIGKAFAELGFVKGYPSGLQLWNPTKYIGQSMDVKEEAATAYAKVLQKYGYKAYMGSRAD
jgi:hypothetical protein|tara:strand:- start:24360 stop:24737 length:378 start_codon:yes stop_codon:yes gene_type:complete